MKQVLERLKALEATVKVFERHLRGKEVTLNQEESDKVVELLQMKLHMIKQLTHMLLKQNRSKMMMDHKLNACRRVMTDEQLQKVFPVTSWDKNR